MMLSAAVAAIALLLVVLLAAAVYLRYRWPVLFEQAARRSFEAADLDGSGAIDKGEFYAAVLRLYLDLALYGIAVQAPHRATLDKILIEADSDNSGTLNFQEYKAILAVLSRQTLTRATLQIVFTLACPFLAGYICYCLQLLMIKVMSLHPPSHAKVISFCDLLPSHLDETLLAGVMMMSIYPMLRHVDQRAERDAERIRSQVITGSAPGHGALLSRVTGFSPIDGATYYQVATDYKRQSFSVQRRFRDFEALHGKIYVDLGLEERFPLKKHLLSWLRSSVKYRRVDDFTAYLRRACEAAGARPPQALLEFLGVSPAKER